MLTRHWRGIGKKEDYLKLEEIRKDKKKNNIFLIAYILFAMIFLLIFTVNYKKIYTSIKNYEYKQFELRMENRIQPNKDYSLKTDNKFNLIFELYLIISFVLFMGYYEKNKTIMKIMILAILFINILYSRFIYSKIQIELTENFIVDYIVCFSFMFFSIYEIIYLYSNKILKKEYKIQALKINFVEDSGCWFLTVLNFLLAMGTSILLKNLIYNKI